MFLCSFLSWWFMSFHWLENLSSSIWNSDLQTAACLSQGWQTVAHAANMLTTCFCASLNGWGKGIERRVIFYDLWKFHEIQISAYINKMFLEHSHHHSLWVTGGCLCAAVAGLNIRTEPLWSTPLQYLLFGLLKENLPTSVLKNHLVPGIVG